MTELSDSIYSDAHLKTIRRCNGASTAIVFLHGFAGDPNETWGRFPEFIGADPRLASWDIFSLGYASSLRVDVPWVWDADPPLGRICLSFKTALVTSPLSEYRSIAIVAHSMGGLVAQSALLDTSIAQRVGHLTLFGTPSRGLLKALIGAALKRQARGMAAFGPFILLLRCRWWLRYRKRMPFELRVVAGERDEFVPPRSSLGPFPKHLQRVVPGNHLGIVKPEAAGSRCVQIVADSIAGESRTRSAIDIDSAVAALERRDFEAAIATLGPKEKAGEQLDQDARIALALALESTGQISEALAVLENPHAGPPTTDAQGVLAGRLKRRWLLGRLERDWQRARDLYEVALRLSDPSDIGRDHEDFQEHTPPTGAAIDATCDQDQAMYHSINIAFLELMHSTSASAPPPAARRFASRAMFYASRAMIGHWRSATEGDAYAMQGNFEAACERYREARSLVAKPREAESMYSQALLIATRVFTSAQARVVACTFYISEHGKVSS